MIGPERRGAGPTAKHDLAPIATAVLVSGSGTNLQAVIEATRRGEFPLDIKLVVSSRPGVLALERARKAHIHAVVRPFHAAQHDRNEYAGKLASLLRSYGIELVLLLGWMHVLAPKFLRAGFSGVLNLHPAYLPEDPAADSVAFPDGTRSQAFRGPRALRDALRAGAPFAGASLIQITEEVDR